ncbi:hypothetical protein ACIQJT_35310 [Streptomyces sp. NPDC091972]|uniref:hypothetical protein n=1 Tax=Streptomyces sp. NPDC091972 TaxID=3366007 RepID=UPI00382DC054
MAGTMNDFCSAIREEVTELLLLGRPLPAPLARHVASCKGCSEEAEGVRRVMRTFERADSPHVAYGFKTGQTSPAAAPTRKQGRVRRRAAAGIASLVLAACAAFSTVVATSGNDSHTSATSVHVAQDGEMVAHPWGTEIPVALSGLEDGSTYRLMTGNARGERLQAGSVQASDQSNAPMRVRLTTAMRKDTITTLYVQDADGHFIAQTPVGPHPST